MWHPGLATTLAFAFGWSIGWAMLWRSRALPLPSAAQSRPAMAVLIPARDEAGPLPVLLRAVTAQLREGDECIVIDDGSADATAGVARAAGVRVAAAPSVPAGWLGKPAALWHGVGLTTAPVLVFIDADVTPAPDLLDRLGAAQRSAPGGLVSVQPWHRPQRWWEQASCLFNVVALMGTGAFTVLGRRAGHRAGVAFGPVLCCERERYTSLGGHAHSAVRVRVTEDIGLARLFGSVALFTGGHEGTSFRMFPGGPSATARGWVKHIATGAVAARWWCTALVTAWMASLAGGALVSPYFYAASAIQVGVLGRRAGRFGVVTALAYPVLVVVFVGVFVRSAVAVAFHRDVTWKGRSVAAG